MSEFDAFTGAEEKDPAADFLAREQDQLAALEDDGFGSVDTEDVTQAPAAQEGGFGDAFGDPAPGEPEEEVPTADFGVIDSNDFTDEFGQDSAAPEGYSAIASVDKQRQEPEKIRLWREEQVERLTEKDAESEIKKGEWREIAKKELEDWYKHCNEQLEKTKLNNREAEAAFVLERDETTPGHEWEKICRLCEFNPKHSRNTKDVSRMRSILLQLKQTPLVR